jgi:hypothetical protein
MVRNLSNLVPAPAFQSWVSESMPGDRKSRSEKCAGPALPGSSRSAAIITVRIPVVIEANRWPMMSGCLISSRSLPAGLAAIAAPARLGRGSLRFLVWGADLSASAWGD